MKVVEAKRVRMSPVIVFLKEHMIGTALAFSDKEKQKRTNGIAGSDRMKIKSYFHRSLISIFSAIILHSSSSVPSISTISPFFGMYSLNSMLWIFMSIKEYGGSMSRIVRI